MTDAPSTPAAPGIRVSPVPTVLARAAVGLGLLVIAGFLYRELRDGIVLRPWQASQFWVDYSTGFTRRGLPGALLTLIANGPPPSALVTSAGIVVSLGALAGWVYLGAAAVRRVTSRPARLMITAVFVASPFTFSEVVSDIGRYDALCVVVAALLVGVATREALPTVTAAVTVALALVVALGAGEIQAAVLLPLAVAALRRRGYSHRTAAAVVAPALTLGVISALVSISNAQVRIMATTAHAQRPDIAADGSGTAILSLRQTLGSVLRNFGEYRWWTYPSLMLLFALVAGSAVWLLWVQLGRPVPPGVLLGWLTYFSLVACVLSVLGVDVRRWWALAFVGAVTAVLIAARTTSRSEPRPRRRVAVAILTLSVVGAALLPSTAGLVDPGAQGSLQWVDRYGP